MSKHRMYKYIDIGLRLRDFARKKFKTNAGLEAALGMRLNSLSQYFYGRTRPGPELQERLRSVDCDIDWLMTGKTKVEYKQQEENSELALLREEVEKLRGENEAFRRDLPSHVVGVILETVKKHPTQRGKKK